MAYNLHIPIDTPWYFVFFFLVIGAYSLTKLLLLVVERGRDATPSITVEPSSGPSPELTLAITNNGRSSKFHATCRVLGLANSPNEAKKGLYRLAWSDTKEPSRTLARNDSASLLIAEFTLRKRQGEWGELTLMEFRPDRPSGFPFDECRWNPEPGATCLPEYKLEISVVGAHWAKPAIKLFLLRPRSPRGPLVLLEV